MLKQRARLHGQDVAYDELVGDGPLLVLVHGVGSGRRSWETVLPRLEARGARAIALDLPGHGESGKGRGDYSLGSFASTVRDLMDHLGHDTAIIVGHSLGGGIAMQFAYQYPERCDGLVLVSSGGLGREASPLLRAATLPGSELVLPVIGHPRMVSAISWVGGAVARVRGEGLALSSDTITTLEGLGDPETRTAFLATLRSVVDLSGQRVSAIEKLSTASHLPTMLVWGDRDPIIPCQHGRDAVELFAQGRLVVFRGAGHEPHLYDPERFADLVLEHAHLIEARQPAAPARRARARAAGAASVRAASAT